MPTATLRTVLPLTLVTATRMLAMDIYLPPAVPVLQAGLGIQVAAAQATVAIFLAGLAASQLLWGEALNRLGPRRCLQWGVGALVLHAIDWRGLFWIVGGVALAVLALLAMGSVGTQGVAPFMPGDTVVPLAAAMLAMLLVSVVLVLPYPPRPAARHPPEA